MSDSNTKPINPFVKGISFDTQNASPINQFGKEAENLSMFDRLKNLPKHYDNSSNNILSKLNGLNITLPDGNTTINIDDIMCKNIDENERDFEIRKRLTKILLQKEKINTITAINIGNMIMKKCKLGLKYDVDTEAVITYFMKKL